MKSALLSYLQESLQWHDLSILPSISRQKQRTPLSLRIEYLCWVSKMESVEKWLRRRTTFFVPLALFVMFVIMWFSFYFLGISSFNKNNSVSIFGTVIQGMSALLSVAIAVIIFRIQSLENRNQSLEQTTLNYIFQITQAVYPQWSSSVENDIRSKGLTNRYFSSRVDANEAGFLPRKYTKEELQKDRDEQQKRLKETLNLHNKTNQTIRRIKSGVFSSVVFLVFPILFSFLLLMVSDSLDPSYNFIYVSIMVLMSMIGITLLLKLVLESTINQ